MTTGTLAHVMDAGVVHFNSGRYKKAADCFRSALDSGMRGPDSKVFLIEALVSLGRSEILADRAGKAERWFREALDIDPRCVPALRSLASLLRGRGRLAESAKMIETALRLDPKDAELRASLAEVYRRAGRVKAAVRVLSALPGAGSNTLLERAELALDAGDDRRAGALLVRLTRLPADSVPERLDKMRAWLLLARFPDAFKEGEKILDLDRSQKTLERLINRFATWPARPVVAPALLARMEKYGRDNPASPWPRLLLADVLEKLGRCDEALAWTTRMVRSSPRYSWMRYVRGRMLLTQRGLVGDAEVEFKAAARAAPLMWNAPAHLAEVLLSRGRIQQAFRRMDGLVERHTGLERAEILAWRGELRLWIGHYRLALRDLEEAVAGGAPFALCWRGAANAKLGGREAGLSDLNASLALNPIDSEALVWRGEVFRLMGDSRAAAVDLEAALSMGSKNLWALANRCLLRLAAGDVDGAAADLAAIDPMDLRRVRRGPARDSIRASAEGLLRKARGIRRPEAYLRAVWADRRKGELP